MSAKRYSPEEVIAKLREAEVLLSQGMTVVEAVRKLGISEQTYYRWKKEYGGLDKTQARKLKELEKENLQLFRWLDYHNLWYKDRGQANGP
jgi:transposase